MKQGKKTVTQSKSKKKIVKKIRLVKDQRKFSIKLLISIVILFIILFVIVFFSSQKQSVLGIASQLSPSPVLPTFGSIGDCTINHDCPTGTGTNSSQQTVITTEMIRSPTTAVYSSDNQTTNPCISAKDAYVIAMSKTHSSSNSQGNFLQIILQFLQLLLEFFQQLLEEGGNGTTPANPQSTIVPVVAPSVNPSPSTSLTPCPQSTSVPLPSLSTLQPTSVSQPTSEPAPTAGTTASCVTSAINGRCPSSGYYTDPQIVGGTNPWVNQNIWGAGGTNYQQTLHANGAGDWYITASVSNNSSGAVLTFPNTGWSMPAKTIDSYSTITSSWNVTIPTDNKTSAGWAAYDLWFNNWADEVMIQTDIVANSNYNCSSIASTTINGQSWHLCVFGSERVVKPGTDDDNLRNETSGSVDIKAVLQWLEQTGHLPANSTWTAGGFGFEVTNTSGTTQTFGVNGFTWTSQ